VFLTAISHIRAGMWLSTDARVIVPGRTATCAALCYAMPPTPWP